MGETALKRREQPSADKKSPNLVLLKNTEKKPAEDEGFFGQDPEMQYSWEKDWDKWKTNNHQAIEGLKKRLQSLNQIKEGIKISREGLKNFANLVKNIEEEEALLKQFQYDLKQTPKSGKEAAEVTGMMDESIKTHNTIIDTLYKRYDELAYQHELDEVADAPRGPKTSEEKIPNITEAELFEKDALDAASLPSGHRQSTPKLSLMQKIKRSFGRAAAGIVFIWGGMFGQGKMETAEAESASNSNESTPVMATGHEVNEGEEVIVITDRWDAIAAKGGLEAYLPQGAIIEGINIIAGSSPEYSGPASLLPGKIDKGNIKIAKEGRAPYAQEKLKRMSGEKLKGVKTEVVGIEHQYSPAEWQTLLGIAKEQGIKPNAKTKNAELKEAEMIFQLTLRYDQGKMKKYAADLDAIIGNKRNVVIEVKYAGGKLVLETTFKSGDSVDRQFERPFTSIQDTILTASAPEPAIDHGRGSSATSRLKAIEKPSLPSGGWQKTMRAEEPVTSPLYEKAQEAQKLRAAALALEQNAEEAAGTPAILPPVEKVKTRGRHELRPIDLPLSTGGKMKPIAPEQKAEASLPLLDKQTKSELQQNFANLINNMAISRELKKTLQDRSENISSYADAADLTRALTHLSIVTAVDSPTAAQEAAAEIKRLTDENAIYGEALSDPAVAQLLKEFKKYHYSWYGPNFKPLIEKYR